MNYKFRLLKDNIKEPKKHFAVEEAILRGVDKGISPATLRLRRAIPSVWIGLYQDIDEDINLDYCKKKNIPVVRRHNPGGTVYQDEGSFCFSCFFKKKDFFYYIDITDPDGLYNKFGQVVVRTCKKYGIEADISPVNDVTVNGKKIYGSAETDFYSSFVHSGTFLINVDIDEMQKVLSPSNLKFIDKGFTNVKERVVNINELSEKDIKINEFMLEFVKNFSDLFNVLIKEKGLLKKEKKIIDKLYKEKYSKKNWTFKKFPKTAEKISKKTVSGIINLHINISDDNIIEKFYLSGDFLISDSKSINKFYENITGARVENAFKIIKKSSLPDNIKKNISEMINKI